MICAIHVSCRDVKWTGTLAQSEREIEIFQTLRHRYTYGILCEENVCAEKHIFITPPTDMSFTRMYRQAYLTWSCNIHEATCKQACKHRSKRIGRLPNGSRKVHSTVRFGVGVSTVYKNYNNQSVPAVSFALASRVIWVLNSHVGATGTQLTYNLPPSRTSGRVYRTSSRFVSSFVSTGYRWTIIIRVLTVSFALASRVIWVLSSHELVQ